LASILLGVLFVRDAVVNWPNYQWRLTGRQEPFAAVDVKVRLADFADLGFSDFADAEFFRGCGTYSAAMQHI